jgi:hypothetical protein
MPVAVESHQPLGVRRDGQRAAASGRDALRHRASLHSTARATEGSTRPLKKLGLIGNGKWEMANCQAFSIFHSRFAIQDAFSASLRNLSVTSGIPDVRDVGVSASTIEQST